MADLACARCGFTSGGVELESSRTAYHHEPGTPDPNLLVPLCRACAKEHHSYWDDMWAEYRSGLL